MKSAISSVMSCLFFSGLAVVTYAEETPSETKQADVVVQNMSGGLIACGLLFAHWYRQDYPAISPGSEMVLPLHLAPATEAVYVINSVNRPMAVQDLYCAASGANWKDVTHVDYRALALKATEQPVHLKCVSGNAKLMCGSYTQ